MKRTTLFLVLLAAAIAAAVTGWLKAGRMARESAELRTQVEALQEQQSAAASEQNSAAQKEIENLRAQSQELLRLRGEVSRLRNSTKETEKLRADLQRLRAENQRLQAASGGTPAAANTNSQSDQFPRESWNFAGYATPDAALVSAIWAMKEGNPKTYLESLSPEEQARMSKVWENKSESEIAAKHQSDVSSITGMRVLDRTTISPEEVQMSVYIQGLDRMEKVSMKLMNSEWKFGGFIRDPKK
jgi:hypothetical protein